MLFDGGGFGRRKRAVKKTKNLALGKAGHGVGGSILNSFLGCIKNYFCEISKTLRDVSNCTPRFSQFGFPNTRSKNAIAVFWYGDRGMPTSSDLDLQIEITWFEEGELYVHKPP